MAPLKTDMRQHHLLFALLATVACATSRAGDYPRNEALYLEMRDGIRIAIDVWLPEDLRDTQRIPTLMNATRYWRARNTVEDGLHNDSRYDEAQTVNAAGYALVLVDARGSGASFGHRPYEMNVEEARDYGEIVDWIIRQPWSNDRVGAYGNSYAGNTAEMLAINRHPAVKAVAPLFNDFDNFGHLVFPGGLLTVGFLEDWGHSVHSLDRNDICAARKVSGNECEAVQSTVLGVKPVDADVDGSLLARAVADHASNIHPYQAALDYEFRDDPWGGEGGVRNVGYLRSPAGHLPAIEASGVAMFVRAGWQDAATVNGTLGRYMTIDNPQKVFIGPWDHGAHNDADPFHPVDRPVEPTAEQQWREMLAFFDAYLKPDGTGPIESSVTYYTLGADRWQMTRTWPPENFDYENWYFSRDGSLTTVAPEDDSGSDDYTIRYDVSTGRHNRWYTNKGAGDVIYADRRDEDKKLLTYTSAPFEIDKEITGHPIVTLFVSSTHEDGAFIVYLEDVAPDGKVTYITEGQLRALVRRESSDPAPYRKLGPHRSELRADALPLVPGEVANLSFELWATSVLIKKNHRLRIAVAGADKDTFLRYPRNGEVPTITVERNRQYPSHVSLPVNR